LPLLPFQLTAGIKL